VQQQQQKGMAIQLALQQQQQLMSAAGAAAGQQLTAAPVMQSMALARHGGWILRCCQSHLSCKWHWTVNLAAL